MTKKLDPNQSSALNEIYQEYFIDYASYVILERAIPAAYDGLKPVQRRILHSMKEMDDGRYHKVANIIGQTMQYHPHGDAAIGDALVKLGQKDLLIDWQGNWGDVRTGDPAAASRYIEARLSKFALHAAFNKKTTDWQMSYDGRNEEPIVLPMKFPLLLAQGADGIAVGLSTKLLPHNFNELIDASIAHLKGKRFKIYPDFATGGKIDVSDYQDGKRGGRVRVRARIEKLDKDTLVIKEIPYGTTTTSLIESIIKANDKGKINIKRITDNTAKDISIQIDLAPGVHPDVAIDALYAFTSCESSLAPNACVVIDFKPHFLTVSELLKLSTERTKKLLGLELRIEKAELEKKWHHASLEKIFIENRVYREIEEAESWEEVLKIIDTEMRKYIVEPDEKVGPNDTRLRLFAPFTEEDIVRLTEIKIKRISKYNKFKADEYLQGLQDELARVAHDMAHLTEYTIAYFEELKKKFGADQDRKTEITTFDDIEMKEVAANNTKLYVDRKEGFVGYGLKKEEFICECSDIDDIIAFRKDGKFQVSRIAEKVFMGKHIMHAAVWKKGDERTTYNMIYLDVNTGRTMAKRFNVKSITRDREYDLTTDNPRNKVLYFAPHKNGETEVVTVYLSAGSKARKKVFDFDFGDLEIKGRGSKGNIVSRYPVRKIEFKEKGKSSLGAQILYLDAAAGRINANGTGTELGPFDTGDYLIILYKDGHYEQAKIDYKRRFDMASILEISKWREDQVISAVYFDSERDTTYVKRFLIETNTLGNRFKFIDDGQKSALLYATTHKNPIISYKEKRNNSDFQEVRLAEFIDVKGWKSMGNKLMAGKPYKVLEVETDEPETADDTIAEDTLHTAEVQSPEVSPEGPKDDAKEEKTASQDESVKPGDVIDFDVDDDGQGSLF